MVWILRLGSEVLGVFDDCHELALAIWQHREELYLTRWVNELSDIEDYMEETPVDCNNLMANGSIADYTLNIDYTNYRLPSLTEEMYKKEGR